MKQMVINNSDKMKEIGLWYSHSYVKLLTLYLTLQAQLQVQFWLQAHHSVLNVNHSCSSAVSLLYITRNRVEIVVWRIFGYHLP